MILRIKKPLVLASIILSVSILTASAFPDDHPNPVVKNISTPLADSGIVMGPYLQNSTGNSITVIWWTNFSAAKDTSRVELGSSADKELGRKVYAKEAGAEDTGFEGYYRQEARIDGLMADTRYSYRVVTGDGGMEYTSPVWSFRSAPGRFSDMRFAIVGDGRTDDQDVRARHRAVFRAIIGFEPSMALYLGDMVMNGSQAHWKRFIREVICANDERETGDTAGHKMPIFMTVGNHEILEGGITGGGNLDTAMKRFKAICDNPDNGCRYPDWKERYYSFSYGPCYIIVLDTNNTADEKLDNNVELERGDTPDWEPGSEQYNWMVERLIYAQNRYPFTFVAMHPSPYSRGAHGGPGDKETGYTLRVLDPVFRQYGVDAVFAAHDHVVERSVTGPQVFYRKYSLAPDKAMGDPRIWQDEKNLNYITQGNSGEGSRRAGPDWKSWMSIDGTGKPPYFTSYYYNHAYDHDGWEGNSAYSSFHDVTITRNKDKNLWRASFKVVRTDVEGKLSAHDGWWIERPDPLQPPISK